MTRHLYDQDFDALPFFITNMLSETAEQHIRIQRSLDLKDTWRLNSKTGPAKMNGENQKRVWRRIRFAVTEAEFFVDRIPKAPESENPHPMKWLEDDVVPDPVRSTKPLNHPPYEWARHHHDPPPALEQICRIIWGCMPVQAPTDEPERWGRVRLRGKIRFLFGEEAIRVHPYQGQKDKVDDGRTDWKPDVNLTFSHSEGWGPQCDIESSFIWHGYNQGYDGTTWARTAACAFRLDSAKNSRIHPNSSVTSAQVFTVLRRLNKMALHAQRAMWRADHGDAEKSLAIFETHLNKDSPFKEIIVSFPVARSRKMHQTTITSI